MIAYSVAENIGLPVMLNCTMAFIGQSVTKELIRNGITDKDTVKFWY